MQALAFRDTRFDVIDRNGQHWLRLSQIGRALGYANPHKVQKVYDRHADEFSEGMTALIKLPDLLPQSGAADTHLHPQIEDAGRRLHLQNGGAGQFREVRIFSLRGAHLLGMFARTPVAAEFRRWVLQPLANQLDRVGRHLQQAAANALLPLDTNAKH